MCIGGECGGYNIGRWEFRVGHGRVVGGDKRSKAEWSFE